MHKHTKRMASIQPRNTWTLSKTATEALLTYDAFSLALRAFPAGSAFSVEKGCTYLWYGSPLAILIPR